MGKRKPLVKQDSYAIGAHQIGFITKVELRRHFLKTYHAKGPIKVLDCCQGEGSIWGRLRAEFKVDQYWGVDIKQKRGRLEIDSRRILAQPGLEQNVYDIDTYGSPWKHWLALLANGPAAMTVFLTFGRGTFGSGWDNALTDSLGLHLKQIPDGLIAKVACSLGVQFCLGRATSYGYTIVDCREAIPHHHFKTGVGKARHARYFGIRLSKGGSGNGSS